MATHFKITKRAVDQLQGDGAEKFYWDDDLPGFGVRIRSSGRKYYVAQFRADGRMRRITLGRHGAVPRPLRPARQGQGGSPGEDGAAHVHGVDPEGEGPG